MKKSLTERVDVGRRASLSPSVPAGHDLEANRDGNRFPLGTVALPLPLLVGRYPVES